MSIFGSIMSKIFHTGEASAAPAPQAPPTAPTSPPPSPSAPASDSPASSTAGSSPATTGAGAPAGSVDVAAILDGLAAKNSQKLDWKRSIVDLMKLLDLDSSLTARKSLAQELHYTGSTDDSATMNVWLHKQVMQKLAENGGKVPDELKD